MKTLIKALVILTFSLMANLANAADAKDIATILSQPEVASEIGNANVLEIRNLLFTEQREGYSILYRKFDGSNLRTCSLEAAVKTLCPPCAQPLPPGRPSVCKCTTGVFFNPSSVSCLE